METDGRAAAMDTVIAVMNGDWWEIAEQEVLFIANKTSVVPLNRQLSLL